MCINIQVYIYNIVDSFVQKNGHFLLTIINWYI